MKWVRASPPVLATCSQVALQQADMQAVEALPSALPQVELPRAELPEAELPQAEPLAALAQLVRLAATLAPTSLVLCAKRLLAQMKVLSVSRLSYLE